jgi:hypothetical protein
MASEMVIFTRTYDFISWLIPRLKCSRRVAKSGGYGPGFDNPGRAG